MTNSTIANLCLPELSPAPDDMLLKRKTEDENTEEQKRPKLFTPDATVGSPESQQNESKENENEDNGMKEEVKEEIEEVRSEDFTESSETSAKEAAKAAKQLEKLEKQNQRKLEKEKKDEEKRKKEAEKEAKRKRIEEEKLEKERKKERERLEKERKKEEKLEKERKREEERLEKERKKEEERLEKERKREEERLEKERKKEEERKRKEEREKERLEKKRKAEEEKIRKEEERKKAEEEKRKADEAKERSQMKISAFFQVRKTGTTKSVESETSPAKESVYEQMFLPFFQKQNVKLHRSGQLDPESLAASKADFDAIIASEEPQNSSLLEFLKPKHQVSPPTRSCSPQDIMEALDSSTTTENQIYEMIQQLEPIKYLQFYENKKPPYIGTWCSKEHKATVVSFTNPFETSTGLNYDYDSDLDWNDAEEGEGEDIEDEDDDDEEDTTMDEEGEMDDFVEANELKMKRYLGPVLNVWNDGKEHAELFDEMKYERLEFDIHLPIDPLHNYWDQTPVAEESEPPQKKTIQDPKVKYELIQFIEKNNDFPINTLADLAKKELKHFTKILVKQTIQDIAVYNKKLGTWEVKLELKEELAAAAK